MVAAGHLASMLLTSIFHLNTQAMKKVILLSACSFLAILLLCGSASAQARAQYASLTQKTAFADNYTTPAEISTGMEAAIPVTSVTDKVSRSFRQSFKDAAPEWFTLNRNYLAKFTVSDLPARALFSKNGYMLYCVSYGTEKSLPKNVRDMIRSTYYDYTITSVTKVDAQDRTAWMVNLLLDNHLKVIKVIDRNMEVIGNYQ